MTSSNDLQKLIESREQEEISLQVLLSERRKRKFDEICDEESSSSSIVAMPQRPREDLPTQALLSEIWIKAKELHAVYSKQPALEKAFVFLTMNSIINLTFDYTQIASVCKQKVDAYKEKNGFADPRLGQVSRRIMKNITKHAREEAPAVGRFVDCSIRAFSTSSKRRATLLSYLFALLNDVRVPNR